jgi:hypothetical protein
LELVGAFETQLVESKGLRLDALTKDVLTREERAAIRDRALRRVTQRRDDLAFFRAQLGKK